MDVLVIEDNLMWSTRLKHSIESCGHRATVVSRPVDAYPTCEVAIVNLGSLVFPLGPTVTRLRDSGAKVVGHAGHKEKELVATGNEAGCDLVVSNSTLTFKLGEVLSQLVESVDQAH